MSFIQQAPDVSGDPVHLFVDWSNLWYAMREEARRRGDPELSVRVHIAHLRDVLAGGRDVETAVLVANRAIPGPVIDHLRAAFTVEFVEPGRISGREQAGDELLQNALYRTILRRSGASGTVVLATGDGAGWREGRGFCEALAAAARTGHAVEVAAFTCSLNEHLAELARHLGAMVPLDPFYDAITFLEGRRTARVPNLAHRPFAARAHHMTEGRAA